MINLGLLITLIALVIGGLILAYLIRATWSYLIPGLLLILLIVWLLLV